MRRTALYVALLLGGLVISAVASGDLTLEFGRLQIAGTQLSNIRVIQRFRQASIHILIVDDLL